MTDDQLRKALARAWNLGQTYWQQADSESYAENRRSDATREKYLALIEETCAALSTAPAAPTADAQAVGEVAWMVKGSFTELFTDLEEAHKYAATIGAKVITLRSTDTEEAFDFEKLPSILACEIECSIFEEHVLPALEVARKALAAPTEKVTADAQATESNFCENCAMDLATCDCVEPRPIRAIDSNDWKSRALAAEELNRKFMASVNGPTHMGEPVAPISYARAIERECATPPTEAAHAARDVMAETREALEGIRRYGLDTLSGRVDGPDDREWQRAAVNEMTKRARLGIERIDRAGIRSVPPLQASKEPPK